MNQMSVGTHKASSEAELSSKTKDLLFVLGRTASLVFALRALLRARRDGSDRLEQLDGLLLFAGAVTSLLIGVRKLRQGSSGSDSGSRKEDEE